MKMSSRGDELLELHEQAALADLRVQRIEGLHRVDALGRHVALAERRHAEVDEGVAQRGCAEAAGGQRDVGSRGRGEGLGLRLARSSNATGPARLSPAARNSAAASMPPVTEGPASSLAGSRVLVTGASGLIGSHLLRVLDPAVEVVAVSRADASRRGRRALAGLRPRRAGRGRRPRRLGAAGRGRPPGRRRARRPVARGGRRRRCGRTWSPPSSCSRRPHARAAGGSSSAGR